MWQDIEILGPDDLYYDQTSGVRRRTTPPAYYNPEGWIQDAQGNIFVAASPRSSESGCHASGPYMQVRASVGVARGARGQFWVPPSSGVFHGLGVDDNTRLSTRDAPCIYFSIGSIVEGGVYYMRGNWGSLRNGVEYGAPGYERWIPYMKYDKYYKGNPTPLAGDPKKTSNHIRYFGTSPLYGLILSIEFLPDIKKKHVETKVQAWEGTDDGRGDPFFAKPLVVSVKEVKHLPSRLELCQTVSIAQNKLPHNYYCQRSGTHFGLWRNSFGQHVPVGVGHMPIGQGSDLDPVQLLLPNGRWADWTSGRLFLCPPGIGAANYDHYTQWYRGHIWITTGPCPP